MQKDNCKHFLVTVRPVGDPILSGHPLLSGKQNKSDFSFPTLTVKNTCIQWTPLLSGRGHLKLDFYGHFCC